MQFLSWIHALFGIPFPGLEMTLACKKNSNIRYGILGWVLLWTLFCSSFCWEYKFWNELLKVNFEDMSDWPRGTGHLHGSHGLIWAPKAKSRDSCKTLAGDFCTVSKKKWKSWLSESRRANMTALGPSTEYELEAEWKNIELWKQCSL